MGFELAVKTGVLWAAAGSTWVLAESERRVRARVEGQREILERLERELQEAEAAGSRDRKLAEMGRGSAAIAHDLATPLMVIRGYAQVRREQAGLDVEFKKDLERIDRAAAFCQQLAATTLSRAKTGEKAVPRVNLLKSAENALALSETVLRSRGIKIRRDYADGDFIVLGRDHELERVFLNLIANAAKAMPDGGTMTVRLSSCETPEGRRVEARIEDTGPGVPAEVLSRLFSPFVTTRAGSGGTGLGLYLCRETARRYGGDLCVFNRPGEGAVFTLRLPLEAVPVPSAT